MMAIALPAGWYRTDVDEATRLHGELQRELPRGHLLYGAAVVAFAHRDGATDDVLFRHLDDPERFTIVHLSWIGRTENDEKHPTLFKAWSTTSKSRLIVRTSRAGKHTSLNIGCRSPISETTTSGHMSYATRWRRAVGTASRT